MTRVDLHRVGQVKAGGTAFIGRHDDSIVALGFQQAAAFAGRETCHAGPAGKTLGVTTAEFKLEDKALAAEEASGSGVTPATGPGRQGDANRLGGQNGRRSSAGVAGGLDSEPDAAKEDGEEEVVTEPVLLSASMDGVIRAWETLGKSEKYRMRHPAGVEVTSMLVLPGGSLLVTGETRKLVAGVAALVTRLL